MVRGIARFVFRRKRKIANIRMVLDLLRRVERQYVERRLAVGDRFDVVFQQRADHQRRAILLRLLHHLLNRLAAGVVDLDLRAAGGRAGFRLSLGSGGLRGRRRRNSRGGRADHGVGFAGRRRLRAFRSGRRVRWLRGRLRRGVQGAVFRIVEAFLNGAGEDLRLTVQRQQQRDGAGRGFGEVLRLAQRRRQGFSRRILRIARLPVFQGGFQHLAVLRVGAPDVKQIQPALQGVFIGVDHQAARLLRRHLRQRLPGGVDVFLTIVAAQQRLLRNIGAQQRQRGFALRGGDLQAVIARLLLFRQVVDFDLIQQLRRARHVLLAEQELRFKQQQLLLLGVAELARQQVDLLAGLRILSFFHQGTDGK